jgi:hypothetical protein
MTYLHAPLPALALLKNLFCTCSLMMSISSGQVMGLMMERTSFHQCDIFLEYERT